jgi:DNA helicase HerA-like ATPase
VTGVTEPRDGPGLEGRLERFRAVRHDLEASVLPLATSVDGRRFSFQSSLHGLELQVGAYVVLGEGRLGQVLSLELAVRDGTDLDLPPDGTSAFGLRTEVPIRHARGAGTVLEGDGAAFHDVLVRPAAPEEVRSWLQRTRPPRAQLPIGELATAPGVEFALDAGGFDRHTFLCGQSGSGKTYSLGVILEQLLLETSLRMVILDPNSDFVRLTEVRGGTAEDTAGRYRRAAAGVEAPIPRLKFADIEPAARAALLRLDPIGDREEHAELAALLAAERSPTLEALAASERPEARRLALRARNLGVDAFGVWARGAPDSLLDALTEDGPRCAVVDLGTLPTRQEQGLVAASVLETLWRWRERREPVLVVIDEAHNVCPARPDDELVALATEHAVRMAAEGRKFGIYLLVSTQRPQKVHENVISQCDNLVLMRLNSMADASFARAVFSFVPSGLVERATTFRLGEALVAGKISPDPALIRFGARIAEEGGADVPRTWAEDQGSSR